MGVVNMKGKTARELRALVRVDRGTKFGNPHVMRNESEREEVIRKYRVHLWQCVKTGNITLDDLRQLHGKQLGCWCAPRACHADVLVKAAAWAVQQ